MTKKKVEWTRGQAKALGGACLVLGGSIALLCGWLIALAYVLPYENPIAVAEMSKVQGTVASAEHVWDRCEGHSRCSSRLPKDTPLGLQIVLSGDSHRYVVPEALFRGDSSKKLFWAFESTATSAMLIHPGAAVRLAVSGRYEESLLGCVFDPGTLGCSWQPTDRPTYGVSVGEAVYLTRSDSIRLIEVSRHMNLVSYLQFTVPFAVIFLLCGLGLLWGARGLKA